MSQQQRQISLNDVSVTTAAEKVANLTDDKVATRRLRNKCHKLVTMIHGYRGMEAIGPEFTLLRQVHNHQSCTISSLIIVYYHVTVLIFVLYSLSRLYYYSSL